MKRKILNIITATAIAIGMIAFPAAADVSDAPADNPVSDTAILTTADALNILKYVAGTGMLTAGQQIIYDVNNDGKIDTEDALAVLRVVAGLSAANPTAPPASNSALTKYDYSDLTLINLRVTTLPEIGRLYLYDAVFTVNAPNVSYIYTQNTTNADIITLAQEGASQIKSNSQTADNAKYDGTAKIINFQAHPNFTEHTIKLTVILYDSNINPIGHVILSVIIPEEQSGLWQWQ